jgi:hypothetical protein
MELITEKALKDHILAHCKPAVVRTKEYEWSYMLTKLVSPGRKSRHGFFTVTKQMHVFKKVHVKRPSSKFVDAIANLIIPVGAMIYVGEAAFVWNYTDVRKMRVSEAFVHSIVESRKQTPVSVAYAWYTNDFKYNVGATVKPVEKFSKSEEQCDSGIHFFVNLQDALDY